MTKQLIFMFLIETIGVIGPIAISPFVGVFVYYLLALLRPQFLWQYSLPTGFAWSYYPAVATIFVAFVFRRQQPASTTAVQPFNGVHVAITAFAFWVCMSYIMAFDQTVAYSWFLDYIKIFVMFGVSSMLVLNLSHIRYLYYLICCVFTYVAYEANFSYFQYGYSTIQSNGYGGYDNNGIGLMLAMAIPLCYFCWESLTHYIRWMYLAFIPVLMHAVMLTYSRGAMLSLVITVPFLFLRSSYKRYSFWALLAMLALVPIFAGEGIQDRFFSISEHQVDNSAKSRFASWSAGLAIATDYPIFGAGVRNSNLLSFQYGADMEGRTIHNQYIQIAADMGYVGLALYVILLMAFFRTVRRVRAEARLLDQPADDARSCIAIASGVQVSMITFSFGALFLSLDSLELPYLLILIAAQLQVILARDRERMNVMIMRDHGSTAN